MTDSVRTREIEISLIPQGAPDLRGAVRVSVDLGSAISYVLGGRKTEGDGTVQRTFSLSRSLPKHSSVLAAERSCSDSGERKEGRH